MYNLTPSDLPSSTASASLESDLAVLFLRFWDGQPGFPPSSSCSYVCWLDERSRMFAAAPE